VKIMGKAQLNRNFSNEEIKEIVSFLNSLTVEISRDAKTYPPELAKK
jgi:hypothetical protein